VIELPRPYSRSDLVALYEQGLSVRAVAKRLGVSHPMVRYDFQRWGITQRKGKQQSGKANPNWRGGVIFRRGWKLIQNPSHPNSTKTGYVAEHTVVACAKYNLTAIPKGKCVHHINLIKADNSPANLSVLTNRQHKVAHEHLARLAVELLLKTGKVRWNEAILNYEPTVD